MDDALKILVIDDSIDDRMLCGRTLSRSMGAHYTVSEAPTGEEGIQMLGRERPSCILLDYSLPGKNGIEILKNIRTQHPFMPVVMLTGQGNEAIAVMAMREGAQNYISKSTITEETLTHAIRMAIEHCMLQKRIDDQRTAMEKTREQLRQSQKMEALGQLTGGIAHDFNNLLAVIIGNLDILHEKIGAEDPLCQFINPSTEAALRGAELTGRLLTFSRRQALQPKVIAINNLLLHFSTLIRRTLGENIEIIISAPEEVGNIHVDPGQLENALLNLSVNARDAMPGGGKIIYETGNVILDEYYAAGNADVMPGDYIMLSVSDTGTGMTPEIMEKVFEPFFTTKETGKGTGLGLSMVYGFVKQSGGHIKVYSEPGHGTAFKLYFPRTEDAVSAIDAWEAGAPISAEKKDKTILVVEDDEKVLAVTSAMVESLGYNVVRASDAEEAINVLKSGKKIAMLLTDVMLTRNVNGAELARQVLEIDPHIVVLFNSGYTAQAIFQNKLVGEGMNFIGKPFRKQQLAKKLAELLK
jgi:signal transduction histidine kinase